MQANNTDEVLDILEQIIDDCKHENNPLGYFASMYRRVTFEVKSKFGTGYFDDDDRMETFDVIFANRYLQAYFDYKKNLPITKAWKVTFEKAADDKLIVLQHLLLGMNAHINLDLGIVTSEISTPENIDHLQNDFNRINEILASLVNEVQDNLTNIWPFLKWILKKLNGREDLIVDFSMHIARDGAWQFAKQYVNTPNEKKLDSISFRDNDILKIVALVTHNNFFTRIIFKIIRWTEIGSVADKINAFKKI